MMTNRKQRRALAKASRGSVGRAVQGVEKAITQLDKLKDIDGTLIELRSSMTETQQALEEISRDFQVLVDGLRTQREITIQLLTVLLGSTVQRDLGDWSENDLARVRALDSSLRGENRPPPQDGSGS